ncbi:MAG: beta-ketoacyl-[acyl-carrier-protein] synthase family protein [Desulfobacteraceae bacterium]|nr:MAG: beta-ketoacyl-[acyl-carrier-protein] synthase family protein [Desulfobacteraceae bacterium]
MKRRVAITGLGLVTPIGIGKELFWDALIAGKSGIKNIRGFDTSHYHTSMGGEIQDFNPAEYLTAEEIEILDRVTHFSIAAARMALDDAKLPGGPNDGKRSGIILGTSTAANNASYCKKWVQEGFRSIQYTDIIKYRPETITDYLAIKYGCRGRTALFVNACAAGTYAVGESFELIRRGKADFMMAGGSETISETVMCGFSNTRSLASGMCRPFDKNRDGLLISEGAAVIILESLDQAIARNAHIYGEVAGYGLSCDAYHMTAPDISGQGASLSMRAALDDAGVSIDDVDYISAHGTGTPLNDKMETTASKSVFGNRAYEIPMSSIKSTLGHTFGASGAIELAACALILERGIIPPTINYQQPDPECDLDYVPNAAIEKTVRVAMSNSYAFGGNNASLIVKKYSTL